MSCTSGPSRTRSGEETIIAFPGQFASRYDVHSSGSSAPPDVSLGAPQYPSRAIEIGALLDFPVSNAIVAGIPNCFDDDFFDENGFVTVYSPYSAGDKDWNIFNSNTECLPIIESDFFEDADACVDYPAAYSSSGLENRNVEEGLSPEEALSLEEEPSLMDFDNIIDSGFDIFHIERIKHIEHIEQALKAFDITSAGDHVPAQTEPADYEETLLQQWRHGLERHEKIAVKFQQPPCNRTPFTTNVRGPNVVVAKQPQHSETSDAGALRTDLDAPMLPGHVTAEQNQQMSSPQSGGFHSSYHLDPAMEDEQNTNKLDQGFTAVLLSLKETFLSKAIQELTQPDSPECNEVEDTGNVSLAPGPNERSGVPSASFNAGFAVSGTGFARKRANERSEKDEEDERSGNGKKKQKEVHGPNDFPDMRKLACPFRKHSPAKFHWRNPRYKTCATGSWENNGKLKDSHIYRNHTAQCSGCKKPMKTLLEFQDHQRSAICINPKTKCIASEGLFEQKIEGLRNLRLRGLGAEKGWNEIYKFLFPNSTPIPDPWWDPPTDDSRPCSDKEELTRRLVAYLEARFKSEHDQIVASKEEILQSLAEMIPVRYTTTPCSKEPISIPELDNGEGSSSMGQRRASSPVPNNNQIANDELVSNHLQDTELFDFDLFHDEFGPTQGFPVIVNFDGGDECSNGGPAVEVPGRFDGNSCLGKGKGIDLGLGMNCELSKEYQDGHRAGFEQGKSYGYRTGWNKGHISGYSAGMKAAEEGYAQLREFQVSSAFNDCGI